MILSRNQPIDSNRDPSCVITRIPSAITPFALASCIVQLNLTETEITRAMIHIIGEFPVCDNMVLKFIDDEGKITTIDKEDRTVIHTDGGKNFVAAVP